MLSIILSMIFSLLILSRFNSATTEMWLVIPSVITFVTISVNLILFELLPNIYSKKLIKVYIENVHIFSDFILIKILNDFGGVNTNYIIERENTFLIKKYPFSSDYIMVEIPMKSKRVPKNIGWILFNYDLFPRFDWIFKHNRFKYKKELGKIIITISSKSPIYYKIEKALI